MPADDDEKPLRQVAYEHIREAILALRYKPGQSVTVSDFARDLGISRTPVREALGLLESDFLVEFQGRQGVRIRDLSLEEVISNMQMREVIDGLGARLAAQRMSDETLADLFARLEDLTRDGPFPDEEAHEAFSTYLHSTIAATCGNAYVSQTWERLHSAFLRVRRHEWLIWKKSGDREKMAERRLAEHREIVEAIAARDPERAEAAARSHIARTLRDTVALLNGL